MFITSGLQIIFFTWKDICPTKTPSWLDKTKLWSDITKIVRLNHGRFLFIVAVKWFTIKYLSGHHVRPHLQFRRTWANFGRPMSDDRYLQPCYMVCVWSWYNAHSGWLIMFPQANYGPARKKPHNKQLINLKVEHSVFVRKSQTSAFPYWPCYFAQSKQQGPGLRFSYKRSHSGLIRSMLKFKDLKFLLEWIWDLKTLNFISRKRNNNTPSAAVNSSHEK